MDFLTLSHTEALPWRVKSGRYSVACWQGGPGGHAPPREDFLGGAKIQRGRHNCWKALVKTFFTIFESDEPMKEKWTEFYRDLRSVWQCLCLCVCHRRTTLATTATPCARATFPNSVILTDQLRSWFRCARFFSNLGQRMIKLLTAENTAWCACALTLLATSSVCSQTAQRMWNCELLIC